MRIAPVLLLSGLAVAGTALLASQPVQPPQNRILSVTTVGPAPSARVKDTLIYADWAGRAPGEMRFLEAKTPFEMEVGPEFTLAIIERTGGLAELQVTLRPADGGVPAVSGTGSRVIIGNNLRPVPGALFVRTF